jgi:hypothetical protein
MLMAFVDTPQRVQRLTVFPVLAADEPELGYLLVADALRRGLLTLEDDAGSESPWIVLRNSGDLPVLILDCETVQGVGRRLATSQTTLLGPWTATKLPTSCTEAGKWDCVETQEGLSESLPSFPLLDRQVGILAFLDRHLLGLDILGCPQLYQALHRRLLAGYLATAFRARERPGGDGMAELCELEALARDLEAAERVASPCFGHGEYSTLRGPVTGGELRHNGQLVHLSVFPNGVAA